jgi:hypothetical protein
MLADEKINVIPILKNKATGRYLSCLRSATSLPLYMLQSLFELVYWYEDLTLSGLKTRRFLIQRVHLT